MKKNFIIFLLVVFVSSFLQINITNAEELSSRLKGRILIQTESHGEAWYVNPENNKRYYLGLPNDAFNIMSRLGLGISNKDFNALNRTTLQKFSGRILLKVEDKGKAYYVNPEDLKTYYLGFPADAFAVMKNFGLGISNDNLKQIQESPLNLAGFDLTINPGDDFYNYVNANWIKNNKIPADQSSYTTFTILSENNYAKLKKIVEANNPERQIQGSIAQKVLDFYATGMDMEKINFEGIGLLAKEFKRAGDIKNLNDLAIEVGHMHQYSSNPLFYVYANSDSENSQMNITEIWQNGFSLPDKDYYLKDDERSLSVRNEFYKYLKDMFLLTGDSEEMAVKNADTVMNIETQLAKASLSQEEQRDPVATYNKMQLAELESLVPNFQWQLYFKGIGLNDPGKINAGTLSYLKGMSEVLGQTSIDDWKIYLKWNILNANAKYLSQKFVDREFDFNDKFLNGYEEQQARWKSVVDACDNFLGKQLGELYVKENFPPEAKVKMLTMVDNIKSVFRDRIRALDWMSEGTKEEALKKLDAFGVKIGYPDVWPDQAGLEIKNDSYLANILRARSFYFQKDINDIGKPIDPNYWWMNPQTVNAYYSQLRNEIVFPAGILQSPFFDMNADDAMNYGGIGIVIAHEMTHGFDDQGRKYDSAGNLRDWWTSADADNFNAKTKALVDQFNQYSPLQGVFVNGELTLGENIADLGGLTISFNALEKSLANKKTIKIDGFTPEQRFFLSHAQSWKGIFRDERVKLLVENDYHSPAKYRVIGPISNMEAFEKAFNLKPGAPAMRPASERIKIW
jgi:putative endopeptidase